MKTATCAMVLLWTATAVSPLSAATAEETYTVSPALPTPLQNATTQERERKAGLTKIIIGCAMAGVGAVLVVNSRTTLTYVNGSLVDTERSAGFWGGIALAGGGAAVIVLGARQRVNADRPTIVLPLGGSGRSGLELGLGRRTTIGYRLGL